MTKKIPLQYLNKDLAPPEISEWAAAMESKTWLDVRVVDAGLIQRVCVECVHIRRESEYVTLLQHFPTDDGKHGENRLDVECEDVMYMVPTELESMHSLLAIIEPSADEKIQDGFEAMKDAAIQAVVDVTGGTAMALLKSLAAGGIQLKQEMVDRRHLVLWALIEMSDRSPYTLCYECGWRSPMPFQSASQKFTGKHGSPEKWLPVIKKVVKRAQEIGGDEGKKWTRDAGDKWKEICVT